MAIDPTIALGVQPMQNPLDLYGKALSVKNLQNQNTLGDLGVQQAQQQQAQMKALNEAYADPANRNPDGSINYQGVSASLAKANAGSQIPGVMKAGIDQQQALTKLSSEQADLARKHIDVVTAHLGAWNGRQDATPDKITKDIGGLVQSGYLPPQSAQNMLSTLPADPSQIQGWIQQQIKAGMSIKDQLPKTEVKEVGGKTQAFNIDPVTGQATPSTVLGTNPSSELGKIDQDEKSGLISAADAAAARKKATYIQPNAMIMMQQAGGGANFDATKPLPPAQEAQARMIADGGVPMTPSSRNPYALPINARAQQLYADANGGDMTGFGTAHGTLTKGRESFAAGGSNSKTLVSLDTAIHHFDALGKAVDALNNGDIVGLNAVSNYMSKQFGSPKVTNFDTVKALAADEFTKVAAGATSGEGEREAMQKLFSAANSPEQLKQAIAQAQVLMAGKVEGLDNAYKSAYGPSKSVMERVSPETRSVIGRASQSVPSPQSGPVRIFSDADYNALPSGTEFIAPDGSHRRKP